MGGDGVQRGTPDPTIAGPCDDALGDVNQALAKEKVRCADEKVPVEGARPRQLPLLVLYVGDPDDLLEDDRLDDNGHDDDGHVAGSENYSKDAHHHDAICSACCHPLPLFLVAAPRDGRQLDGALCERRRRAAPAVALQ